MKKQLKFVLDDFAARQFDKSKAGLSFIDFNQAEFAQRIQAIWDEGQTELKDGYAPFCKHVFVKNFTPAIPTFIPITESNIQYLKSGYQARRPSELPVLSRWFDLASMPEGSVKQA